MSIRLTEQRKLAQRSGNLCAFPDCRTVLTAVAADGSVVILGQMAHIVAESVDGPRGASALTIEERNQYENLILMCSPHHQYIDAPENVPTFTVERLRGIKEEHERWVEQTMRARAVTRPEAPKMVKDTVHSNVLQLEQMPVRVFGAPCEHKESDIKPGAIRGAT